MTSNDAQSQLGSTYRFTDVSGDHKEMLAPITGYEKMPLVSIDMAVEPLVDHVAEIKRMVWTVKQKCSSPADGLTMDESASIMLYTLESTTRETSFYFILNKCLCTADRSTLKPWLLYMKLLIYSLSKLPSSSIYVYRGVKEDLHDAYPEGSTFVWWGFSSCNTNSVILSRPNFLGTTGPRTIFLIESKSGKNISKHSFMSTENEILLLAARQFQVIASLNSGGGVYIIQVKEIEPAFSLLEPLDKSTTAKLIPVPKTVMSISPYPARWHMKATTVAGGHGRGNGSHQLGGPSGLFVDDDQTLYIADYFNHRVMVWKADAKMGDLLAGNNAAGDRLYQLQHPVDVIIDRETDSILVSERGNRRVMRWPCRPTSLRQGEIFINNIACDGLAIDDQGSVYVSDREKYEVRRYDKGDKTNGTLVAGGHGKGSNLNQLNEPSYLFVDAQSTLYVSDLKNHRVMKWMKGAIEGIVVAGGNGKGEHLTQLSDPTGIWVNERGHVFVADSENHRVVRWENGKVEGTLIVGGKGRGTEANQLYSPESLFFDRHGHLYVADGLNHRVQRFSPLQDES